MPASIPTSTLEKFTAFGDLLRYLRRRVGMTQMELADAVGYSDAQISRLEQNLRLPDLPTIQAHFVPALGLEDEPKTAARLLELAASVRREDAPALGLCPYKGLTYFDEADADLFVGREVLTEKLAQRVLALATDEMRFLAVVGASGSGKSSLVRAGLVPALHWNRKSAEWRVHVFTPTAHPLESLATTFKHESAPITEAAAFTDELARDPRSLHRSAQHGMKPGNLSSLLLVIDQFEELFALCRSEEERAAFIGNLLTAASARDGKLIVVITLRADFYAHCASYPELREALAGQQEYIGAMGDTDLRRAIVEPAERGRWELEPGLVDQLLHDVGNEPGGLPLLSHALLETWQRRRGRTLTLGGYASSGGVRGAIAETAEEVFTDQFSREQQAIARRIFLRLTELGEETSTGDTRRRATFDELVLKPEETDATRAVLTALADARLITISEDAAEVAHEALIREWPTLRGWLEDNREGLRLHRQLTEAAQEWSEAGRDPDALYRGTRLAQAGEWASAHEADLNALEKEFLAASLEASQREADEREAQVQRELEAARKLAESESRSARRLRRRAYLLSAVFALAILLAGVAVFFGNSANRSAKAAQESALTAQKNADEAQQNASTARDAQATAQAESDRADESARTALSRELAVQSKLNLDQDTERSVLLALQAYRTSPSKEALDALHQAVETSRVIMTLKAHTGGVEDITFSPDGQRFASASDDNTVKIWDAETGGLLFTLAGHSESATAVAFSPDGTQLASASNDGSVRLWDPSTGRALSTIDLGAPVWSVDFSPDGKWLVAGAAEGKVRFWDARSGQEVSALSSPEWSAEGLSVAAICLSPDGKRLAISLATQNGASGKLEIWDLSTRQRILDLPVGAAFPGGQKGMVFSPDSTRLALARGAGGVSTASVYDVTSGKRLVSLAVPVNSLMYSPDGRHLLTASTGGKAHVWDAETGELLTTLVGHNRVVGAVGANSDCVYAPAGAWCGTRLATGGASDGVIKVWDITPDGRGEGLILPGVGFSLDGDASHLTTLTTSQEKPGLLTRTLHRWVIPSWTQESLGNLSPSETVTYDGRVSDYAGTAPASSGQWLDYSASGNVTILDATSPGETAATVCCAQLSLITVDTSRDGKLLAIVNPDEASVELWDLVSRRKVRTLTDEAEPDHGIGFVAFSPDSQRLAAGFLDGPVGIWDIASGKLLRTLSGQSRNDPSLAFSPDGNLIAAGSCDTSIFVWEVASGEVKARFQGHSACVNQLTFDRDGRLLASSSPDHTTRVWDLTTGSELATLPLGNSGIRPTSLAFSPDGKMLLANVAYTGTDLDTRIFLLDPNDLVALAKSRLTRSLTTDECQRYLHVEECPADP